MSVVVDIIEVAAPIAAAVVAPEFGIPAAVAAGATSAAVTAIGGGDLGDIVTAGAAGALGSTVGSAVGSSVASEFGNTAGQIAKGAAGGFTSGLIGSGGDIGAALKGAAIGGGTAGVMSAGKAIADTAFPGETTISKTGDVITSGGATGVTPTSPFGTTEYAGATSPFGTTSLGIGSQIPTSPFGTTEEVSKTSPYGTVGTTSQPNVLSGGYPSSTYSPPFSQTSTGKAAQSVLGTQVSSSLADLFAPSGSTAPSGSSVTTTGTAGTTPGTQALGQALRVDPGATLGGGDQTKPQQNVWNLQSLRVKDETGS